MALKAMLDDIDPSSSDLEPLLNIQQVILKHIIATEIRLKQKQKQLKALQEAQSSKAKDGARPPSLKQKISVIKDTISGYKYLLYIWRCFGDGIAFKYISKWNLKRLFFETASANIKSLSQ